MKILPIIIQMVLLAMPLKGKSQQNHFYIDSIKHHTYLMDTLVNAFFSYLAPSCISQSIIHYKAIEGLNTGGGTAYLYFCNERGYKKIIYDGIIDESRFEETYYFLNDTLVCEAVTFSNTKKNAQKKYENFYKNNKLIKGKKITKEKLARSGGYALLKEFSE